MITSLIVPLDNLDFARDKVRIMTDEDENPQNLPTKDNIVRRPCEVLLLHLIFCSAGSDEGTSCWCSNWRLLFPLLYIITRGLDSATYIDKVLYWVIF